MKRTAVWTFLTGMGLATTLVAQPPAPVVPVIPAPLPAAQSLPAPPSPVGDVVHGKMGEKLDGYLSRLEAFGFNGAVFYAKKNVIYLQKAYGYASYEEDRKNTVDTLFDLASVSKQFTTAGILKLQMQGKLQTDDSITKFFPSLSPEKDDIYLYHLMNHTSGLPKVVGSTPETHDLDEFIELIRAAALETPPGEKFNYNNIGFSLLAAVIEKASGQKFEDYMRENVFKPAGLEHMTFLQERPTGGVSTAFAHTSDWEMWPGEEGWYAWGWRGAAGMLATIRDLYRWDLALREDVVLSTNSKAELYNRFLPTYTYGWFVRDDEDKRTVYFHGGNTRGFECHFERCPKDNSVLILLCNDEGKVETIKRGLLGLIANMGASMPPEPVRMTQDELQAYAGEYKLESGGTFILTAEKGAIVARNFGIPAVKERLHELSEADIKRGPRYDKRAAEALEAWRAGDIKPLEDLLPEERAAWAHRTVGEWAVLMEAGGGLKKTELIGTIPKTLEEVHTFAALAADKRTEVIKLIWHDGELQSWDRTYPAVMRFVPVGDEQFISFDITSEPTPRDRAMRFVKDDTGKVTHVAIMIDFVRQFAERAPQVGSTPP